MMRPPDLEAQLRDALQTQTWAEVDRLQTLLDAQDAKDRQRRDAVTLASAALWYAQQGLWVFPLQPGTKEPHKGSHGLSDATTDPDRVRSWWKSRPQSNIGLATGHLVDVIDIDGPQGNKTLADMTSVPPVAGWVSSPRPGGRHIYVHAHPQRRSKTKILPGIDYRGMGGYAVVPPSMIDDRAKPEDHRGGYRWIRPLDLTPREVA